MDNNKGKIFMNEIKEKLNESVKYLWKYKNNKMCFKNRGRKIKIIKIYEIKFNNFLRIANIKIKIK